MNKQIITFDANEQSLIKTGGVDKYSSNKVSYIEAHFNLGENWQGYDSVRAVWSTWYECISTVLDTEGICVVPYEVLKRTEKVMVNLVGSISEDDVLSDRLTTYPVLALTVDANAKVCGSNTQPITPSEYEQFVEAVKADADRAEEAKDEARGFASSAEISAQNASISETNASTSEDNAKVSELNAETYKNQAQTHAQNANNSAISAENAKDEAEDARDTILGMRAEATTLPEGSSATASYNDGVMSFGIPKGDKGDKGNTGETGAPAGFGTVSATVDSSVGTPSVEVTASGADTAKNFAFAFHNLKGQKGDKGDTGDVSQAQLDAAVSDLKSDIDDINDIIKDVGSITYTIGRYNPTTKQKTGTQTDRIFTSLIKCYDDSTTITLPENYRAVWYLYDASENLTASYDSSWKRTPIASNKGGYIVFVFARTDFGTLTDEDISNISPTVVFPNEISDLHDGIDDAKENTDFNRNTIFTTSTTASRFDAEIGGINMSTGADEDSTARIRTTVAFMKKGNSLLIPDGYQASVILYADADATLFKQAEAYWQTGTYVVPSDGYRRLMARKTDSSDISSVSSFADYAYMYEPVSVNRINYYIGTITAATGEVTNPRTDRVSTNFIPVKYAYTISTPAGIAAYMYEYDSSKALIYSHTNLSRNQKIECAETAYVIFVFVKTTYDAFTPQDVITLANDFSFINNVLSGINDLKIPKVTDGYKTPIITIVDDDGRTNLPTFLDMMYGKNVSMTACLITDRVGTDASVSLSQILEYKAKGFDFCSHSATHSKDIYASSPGTGNYTNFALVTDETITADLKRSRDFCVKYGLNSDCITWPWGHYPETFDATMNNPDPEDANVCGAENQQARYANIARGIGYKYGLDSIGGMNKTYCLNPMWISREPFWSDNDTYPESYYQGLVDECILKGGWLILMTHCNDPLYADVTKVSNIVQYAIDKGVSVLNMKDAYEKKHNAVSVGEYSDVYNSYYVGADGLSK